MTVDMGRMRGDRKKADAKSGGALLKFKEGTTLLYICPPVHAEEPVPYLEVETAFNFGPNKNAIVGAEFLEDSEPFREHLEARGVDFEDAREGWDFVADYSDFKTRWYFNVVVVGFRRNPGEEFAGGTPIPRIISVGKTIYDGITDVFFEEGDITDPDAAILVKVKRTGTGLNTDYKVSVDSDTLREPMEIDEETWEEVQKACAPGQSNDLHKFIAGQVKTLEQIHAIHDGEEIDEEDDVERRPARKARTSAKPASRRRRRKKRAQEEESEVEELDEEELDEESEVEYEEELDEESDVEDDEEEFDEEEFDEEELDEDDEDDIDDLERALRERSKKKKKRKKKRKKSAS